MAQLKVGAAQDTLVAARAHHSCFLFCLHFLGGLLNDFVPAASCLHWLGCGVMCNWKAGRTGPWRTAPIIHLDAQGHQHLGLSSPSAIASVPCFSLKNKKEKKNKIEASSLHACSGKLLFLLSHASSPISRLPCSLPRTWLSASLPFSPSCVSLSLSLSLPLALLPLSHTHMHTHCFLYFSLLKFYTSLR